MPKVLLASSSAPRRGDALWERAAPLSRKFFDRDPRLVAPCLLGKLLLRRIGGGLLVGRIVETEAYLGADDAAAHAAAGRTQRNAVLFGPPGHAYVYLTYGLHYCLNVSCLPEGDAGCVLFRALAPLAGFSFMARARGLKLYRGDFSDPRKMRLLSSGPARLCQALAITRAENNGTDMTSRESGVWIADDDYQQREIRTSTRIGITKSARLPLRYYIPGNPYVSQKRASSQ